MKVTIHCSQCPTGEKIVATVENEGIVCRLPRTWGYLLYDIKPGGEDSLDVVLCPKCNKIQQRKWKPQPGPKKTKGVKRKR